MKKLLLMLAIAGCQSTTTTPTSEPPPEAPSPFVVEHDFKISWVTRLYRVFDSELGVTCYVVPRGTDAGSAIWCFRDVRRTEEGR